MLPCRNLLHRLLCTASPSSSFTPWLLVGLGNPGDKFHSTRHNVGFDMIDAFARSQGIPMNTVHFNSLFGEGMVGGMPVLLAKPQTYMNLSGESIFDDMDLPCGVLRIQPKGGHGKHKGLKSVIYSFQGNREFGRLRIGIGRPPGQVDPKAFLLQKFSTTARERTSTLLEQRNMHGVPTCPCLLSCQLMRKCNMVTQIDAALLEGVGILKMLITKGLTECARCANQDQKYKHLRLQTLPDY